MRNYSRYLFKNLIVKKSIYMLVGFFVVLIFALVAIQSNQSNKKDLSYVNSIDTFAKFFPFLLSTCFTIMIVIFNFKSTEKDGSDLLIISKPVKRLNIFSSKILISIFAIICFQSFAFIVYLSAAATDKVATPAMMVNFAASLAIGGLIVQLIVLSILILVASFLNSVSIISVGLVFSAVIPIASLIISQVSHGAPRHFNPNERALIDIGKVKNLPIDKEITDENKTAALDLENMYNMRSMNTDGSSPDIGKYYNWKSNSWYGGVAKFDLWYQLGTFMEMFSSKKTTNSQVVQDWVPSVGYLGIDDSKLWKVKFEVNGRTIEHKIAIMLVPVEVNVDNRMLTQSYENYNTLPAYYDAYNSLLNKGFIHKKGFPPTNHNPDINTLNDDEKSFLRHFAIFMQSKDFMNKWEYLVMTSHTPALTKMRFAKFLFDEMEESRKPDSSGNAPVEFEVWNEDNKWMHYEMPDHIRANTRMFMADKMVGFYLSKPYIKPETITVVWISIMMFLFLVGALSYWKKDIK